MTSDLDPVAPEVNKSSPGKILRDAREKLGLTQEEVANELYMTVTKVNAIESDQFNRLHSDTFIRGYLRAYAQMVKVDLESLMSIYDSQAKILGLKEEYVPIKKSESPSRKIWQFALLFGGVLFIAWLVSVWFFDNHKQEDYSDFRVVSPQSLSSVQASDEEGNPSTGLPMSRANTTTGVNDSPLASQSAGEIQNILPNSAVVDPIRSIISDIKKDQLDFYFNDECWVDVSDAKGDVLVTELQMKDTQLTLKGVSPFDVKLGNAPAVTLKINGKKVEFVPLKSTNVLTLKVGR